MGVKKVRIKDCLMRISPCMHGMSIPSAISIASEDSIDSDVEFGPAWLRWGLPRLQDGSIGVSRRLHNRDSAALVALIPHRDQL